MPGHWMERDSMDTGKRNHMQRHAPSFVDRKRSRDGYALEDAVVEIPGIRRNAFHISSCRNVMPIPPISLMPTALTTIVHTAPAAMTTVLQTVKTDELMAREAIASEIEILSRCKHVDRKRNREACPGALRIRNHKRGYLAVVCDRGHQWVWCSCCCDCERSGIGCGAAQHWMERDSFDTGRRNHMQRHVADYDANNDLDGAIMAELQPRQVAMPKHRGGGSETGEAAGGGGGCETASGSEPRASYAASINDSQPDGSVSPQGEGVGVGGSPGPWGPQGRSLTPGEAVTGGGSVGSASPPATAARWGRDAALGQMWRRATTTKRARATEGGGGRPQREPLGAAMSTPGSGPCGPKETARDDGGPGGRAGAAAGGGDGAAGDGEDELGSVGAAAVALIALRRSVRINGSDD